MSDVTFDEQSAARISDVVEKFERSVQPSGFYPRRTAAPTFGAQPLWQLFAVRACPDQCGYYQGDIVIWDGVTETVIVPGVQGVAANQALAIGKRYAARLVPSSTTTTTTTSSGTTTSTTTTACTRTTTTTTSTTTTAAGTTTTTTTTTAPPTTTTTTTTCPPPNDFIWAVANDEPEFNPCPAGGQATTTSTTPFQPCTGNCKWTWDNTNNVWNLSTNTCCPMSCNCIPPTYCGSMSCEDTTTGCSSDNNVNNIPQPCCPTTTTTTTAAGTTTTTTTTTAAPTTTTTIQPSQGCSGCTWVYIAGQGWVMTINNCYANGCYCSSGPGANANTCATFTQGCFLTPPPGTTTTSTTTCPPCAGSCCWAWDPTCQGKNPAGCWMYTPGLCSSYGLVAGCTGGYLSPPGAACPTCCCEPPSFPGVACAVSITYCFVGSPGAPCAGGSGGGGPTTTTSSGTTTTSSGTTTTTTAGPTTTTSCQPTTTPAPNSCNGQCYWQWNTTTNSWEVISTTCGSQCGCPWPPPYQGSSSCDTYQSPCSNVTTTTAPPTTTTPPPACGTCQWLCLGGGNLWLFVSGNCSAGCACIMPTFQCTAGQIAQTNCNTTTTTTTCNPATTTTPAPGSCGTCQAYYSGVNGLCVFQSIVASCNSNCNCAVPAPAGCCPNGQTVVVTGNCAATTTTTLPPCGTCSFVAKQHVGGLGWVQTANHCTGSCGCQAPGSPPTYLNQQATTNCA